MAEIETYARPTWLYRYRSIGAGMLRDSAAGKKKFSEEIDAILNGYIYCAEFTKMNDPMEGVYKSSRKASEHSEYDRFVEQLRNEKLGLGIASFSETWDNQPMWAHYADNFRGICICYSMSSLLSGLAAENTFSRVAYGEKPYYLNLPSLKNDHDRARAVLSTKHLNWSYEREWRLFSPEKGEAHHGQSAVKSIYFGTRMPKQIQAKLRRKLKPLGIDMHRTKVDGYKVVKEQTIPRAIGQD